MSVYLKIGIPMICVAFTMFYLLRIKKDKNYLIPGVVILMAGVVDVIVGLKLG
ncbi:hypothetical protein [Pantoea cypripedii]|uniref:hypothetical protein n=1 Tax=Pantoea cypripedii TaxID=55209 RepID=UPI001ABFBB6E|nr:hypothetical protein [Pantoea cypripedii]